MTRRPVVLHAIDALRTGGAEWLLGALVTALATEGLTRNVVVAGTPHEADPGLLALLEAHADRVDVLHTTRLADRRFLTGLLRAARPLRPDLVHTHLVGANVNGRLAARVLGVPHVATVHTPPGGAEDSPARLRADGLTARMSARIVAPSQAVADAYARHWHVDRARMRVLPSPVAPRAATDDDRRTLRAALGARDGELLVLCVARLQPAKGVDVLLEAARGLSGVRVVVAGDGPEREALREPARAGGATLLGHRSDVGALLAAADAVCLPSRHEALPLSLLEAMQAASPIVASAVGGIPELLDGDAGLLVPPGDPGALRASLERLAHDAGLRARLGDRARARVEERHSARAVAHAHAGLYDELLA